MSRTASTTLFDISPPLSEALPVWPGDTPLEREVLLDLKRGDTVTLSSIRATVHLGAHADAPSHFSLQGATIDACDLGRYLGPCQLLRVSVKPRALITPAHLPARLEAPRLLLATGTAPANGKFPQDFAALAPELVPHLAEQGVKLVGVDTPSVDPFDSKDLPAHHAMLAHDIAILEGLALEEVPDGLYELIALPLRLVGFDASPVRAVLRTWPTHSDSGGSRS